MRSAAARHFVLAAFALLSFALPAFAQTPPRAGEQAIRIEVHTEPVPYFDLRDPERREFGALIFRGGLELISHQPGFGGLSALRVSPDGNRFLSVSDRGRWVRGDIEYDGTQPKGVSAVEMAPMLGNDGLPLALRGWFDTESLAEDGGTLYVGIERVNQIVRFDYGKDELNARGVPIETPSDVKTLPYNKGLEALVFVPKGMPLGGTLIAISERGLDENGNIKAFLIGGPSPGMFKVTRGDDFDVTDAAVTPNGDLLILERAFSLMRGAGMRIRRTPLAALKPGLLVSGEVLFEADRNYNIDNMEGIAVHRAENGDLVLSLISDDNFNPLERTLFLQFTLAR